MPTLAQKIVVMNTQGGYPHINYKGFAVGNPATNFYSTTPAMLDTIWGHQLVPKPLWDSYQTSCVQSKVPHPQTCETLFTELYLKVRELNPYALDYPVCVSDSPAKYGRGQRFALMRHVFADKSPEFKKMIGLRDEDYQPCEDDWMTSYLNRADVKQALHVKTDVQWTDCARNIHYKQSDGHDDMTPIYNYLLDGPYDLNILVYSGDDDSVCGTIGSQQWVWDLGYSPAGREWTSYLVNNQVGGYLTTFKGVKFAFATVHGAGHEVPTYKPAVALKLFQAYIAGTLDRL